ncbi:MAG: TonB-dependent receptor [Bacteroidales bacterium]|nr:TonB-dependent receptor [Bacteroidales bacterium]
MKKTVVSIILALVSVSMFAKSTIIVGSVKDSLTFEGEPSAVLQFYRNTDLEKPVAFTTTDLDGNFVQELVIEGEYVAVYSNVGRRTVSVSFVTVGEDSLRLADILVQDDVEMLEAGKVTALRPLVKMDVDKMTYKVEDDVDSKTSTVLEMLRKVPMVSVDGEDNITVNGSSSFQVLVDGKPNVMISSNPSEVFRSMPASSIKDIQVITNPGVKYDAEGVGGVLNITTNRSQTGGSLSDLDGYNATVGLNGSTRLENGYGYGLRTYVTGQNNKLTYSANLNLNRNISDGMEMLNTQSMLDPSGNPLSTTTNSSKSGSKSLMGMASLDLGYEIDNLRLVSASAGLMLMNSGSQAEQLAQMVFGTNSISYGSLLDSDMKMKSITASVDYQRSFENNPDRSLVFSYQLSSRPLDSYSKTLFDADNGFAIDLTDRYSKGLSNTVQNTFQIDYSDKWLDCITFNAGAKYISRLNKSDQNQFYDVNGEWVRSDEASELYRHDNNIAAGYLQIAYGAQSFSAKLGARYEHTFQSISYADGKGNSLNVNYGDFVPAASLQYNISMMQNIGLSYSMRIRRPGITFLDPYVDVSDPLTRTYGNPDLSTEKAHTINLVYNYFSNGLMLNFTIRDTYCGNGISSYTFYDEQGLLNTTFGNILKSNTVGANIYANLNIGSKTRVMLNASLDYSVLDNPLLSQHNEGLSGMAMVGLQQTLPWDLRLSLNVMGNTRTKTVDGWTSGMTMAMGSLTKSFLDDRLSVSVSGTLPLAKDLKMVMESHKAGPDYKVDSFNVMPMSQASINITWSFGNKKNVRIKKARTSIVNDDLMDRSTGAESGDDASSMISQTK